MKVNVEKILSVLWLYAYVLDNIFIRWEKKNDNLTALCKNAKYWAFTRRKMGKKRITDWTLWMKESEWQQLSVLYQTMVLMLLIVQTFHCFMEVAQQQPTNGPWRNMTQLPRVPCFIEWFREVELKVSSKQMDIVTTKLQFQPWTKSDPGGTFFLKLSFTYTLNSRNSGLHNELINVFILEGNAPVLKPYITAPCVREKHIFFSFSFFLSSEIVTL